jgi:hypothetical protein
LLAAERRVLRITEAGRAGLADQLGLKLDGLRQHRPHADRQPARTVVGTDRLKGMTDPAPDTDRRHPADVVSAMVDHVLNLAETWPRWDLQPIEVPVQGEPPRIYTPHKAVRRVADHLLDHLAEIEARLAGRSTEPDRWHGSMVTTASDLAPFTPDDLDEARSRLCRLALIWDVRLRSLTDQQLDEPGGESWTLRQVAFHVADSAFYADSVGALAR